MRVLAFLPELPMSTKRPFVDLPLPLVWLAILFLGVPALFDVSTGLRTMALTVTLANVGKLVLSLFLLFCAVRIHRGERASLASPPVELAGKACVALFFACMLAKWMFSA